MQIISAIKYVGHVFVEESLELKREYLVDHEFDLSLKGGLYFHDRTLEALLRR